MARSSIWLKPFSREAKFVVNKPFRWKGVDLLPGQDFDHTLVNVRDHRNLYNQRFLRYADGIGEATRNAAETPISRPEVDTSPVEPANQPAEIPAQKSEESSPVDAPTDPAITEAPQSAQSQDPPPKRKRGHKPRKGVKPSPDGLELRKMTATKYAVFKDGYKISRNMSRDDAEAFLKAQRSS